MSSFTTRTFALAIIITNIPVSAGSIPSEVKRVAFVGNTYTFFNDLPTMFATLSNSAGIHIDHEEVLVVTSSLYEAADYEETQHMLKNSLGWDYVVLQDESQIPGGGKDTIWSPGPGIGVNETIDALKTSYAPLLEAANATAVLFSTWGWPEGDEANAECCNYGDFLSMTAATTVGYRRYADALADALAPRPVLTAPCGRGFELVYNGTSDGLDQYFPCLFRSENPCVLDEQGEGIPSELGTYLVACIMFGTIHGRSPQGLPWAPSSLSDLQKVWMQIVAHNAVFTVV